MTDESAINRLDCAHIDNRSRNAFSFQNLRCLQSFIHQITDGQNRSVGSILDDKTFSDFKLDVRAMHRGGRSPPKPQVDRTLVENRRLHCRFHRKFIAGNDHGHSRDRPHQRQILNALVGGAVLADQHAAMGRTDFYIQMRISDRVADLFVSPARRKHRERGSEDGFAAAGHAGRCAHQILFGDAHIKEAFRIFPGKQTGLCCLGQIAVQNEKIISFPQFRQRFAIRCPRGFRHACSSL